MESMKALKKKKKQELSVKDIIRLAALQAVYFLLGLLVSKGAVLGSLAPFGAAYAAAVPFSYVPVSAFGAGLGYILLGSNDAFRYVAVVAAIAALRWLLNDIKKISTSVLFAPLVAFVPMLATGITLLFVSTSRMTEFSLSLMEAVTAGAGAYFLSRTANLLMSAQSLGSFSKQELAVLSFSGCILVLSLGSLEFYGISAGRIFAVLIILLAARYGSVAGGSIFGTATGVMFSLTSTDMAFLGTGYAFGGLMGGLFASTGKIAVAVAFTLCNTVLSFASKNTQLVLRLFAESAFAVGFFMLIPKAAGIRLKSAFEPKEERAGADAIKTNVIQRLSYASKALDSVKDCVQSVAVRLKAKQGDSFDGVYSYVAENTCKSCGLKSYCWQNQVDVTKDDFYRVAEAIKAEGFVTDATIEDKFTKNCCKAREIAKSFNEGYRDYLSGLEADRRISQVRSATGSQLSSVSRLLSDMCDEFDTFTRYDTAAADRLSEKLRREGFGVTECACRFEQGKGMTVELEIRLSRKKELNKSELRRQVSACCGRVFDAPVVSVSDDSARLSFAELARFDADIGSSQHIAGGKGLCGDSANYYSSGSGNMVAVISDGMGTGGRAAVDSNMAVSILKKLTQAGLSFDSALSVINASLMVKSEEETLATLDVVDINLFSGKVNFFKAGAPLTFVKRGGRILKRESPSLPAGILNDVKFAKDSLNLHHGDKVLMVSDGALFSDDAWLCDMLKGWNDASANDFASLIINEAIKRRNDGYDDDITAIAINIIDLNAA
ncbi:MAG: SpoIIE family protein phosphatase [Ruminococcus sp.]|nr:SpoIIE family protein phosphatase [Ruminococcus sp.]